MTVLTPGQTPFDCDGVLYYPNIEFFSVEWLKRALAVWDRVYRIVPASYRPSDPQEVREAAGAGLVIDIHVDEADLAQVGKEFIEFLGPLEGRPAGLIGEVPTIRVHEEKIDARLRPLMREVYARTGTREWLELPAEIANGYMLFLADVVARRRGIARSTDNADVFTAMQFFSCDGDISDHVLDSEAAELTSALTLSVATPIGVTYAPIQALLEFRRENAEGRAEFRQELSAIMAELSQIEDETFARERVVSRLETLTAAAGPPRLIKKWGEGFASTFFTVAFPTALSVYSVVPAAPQNNPFDGFRIGISIGIAAIAALGQSAVEQRRKWRPTSANYLIGLDNTFGPERQMRTPFLSQHMEEFIND